MTSVGPVFYIPGPMYVEPAYLETLNDIYIQFCFYT